MKRVFAVNTLDVSNLAKARGLKADVYVFNNVDPKAYALLAADKKKVELVDANAFAIKGTHNTYRYNSEVLERLKSVHPQLFSREGIDLTAAFRKALYWTNFRIGYLNECIKQRFPSDEIVFVEPYFSRPFSKAAGKYLQDFFRNIFNGRRTSRELISTSGSWLTGILIKHDFEYKLYANLLNEFRPSELVIFYYDKVSKEFIQELSSKGFTTFDISVIQSSNKFPFSTRYLFLERELLQVVNILSKEWRSLMDDIERWKFIRKFNLKSLVINEGENVPSHMLVKTMLGSGGTKVYNTMNGMKAGTAQNAAVNFDGWFVWDEQMRAMMSEECGLDKNLLIPLGHLAQDALRQYKYRNILNIDEEVIRTKKILSVFSIDGHRKEKTDLLEALYKFIDGNPEYFVLLRAHPTEKESEKVLPSKPLSNLRTVHFDQKNSKETLHEQLYISDLAIVFGSTVALEAKWMGTPSISLETREKSMLYCVDQKDIKFTSKVEEVIEVVRALRKKNQQGRFTEVPVSKKYRDFLVSGR